jgi:hypothetical protein
MRTVEVGDRGGLQDLTDNVNVVAEAYLAAMAAGDPACHFSIFKACEVALAAGYSPVGLKCLLTTSGAGDLQQENFSAGTYRVIRCSFSEASRRVISIKFERVMPYREPHDYRCVYEIGSNTNAMWFQVPESFKDDVSRAKLRARALKIIYWG